ncbi:MAG: low temperature requirement protein A [Chloroflexota bacterium]|nr:low temperature requirement protein A [Chloroflexota bacterium]
MSILLRNFRSWWQPPRNIMDRPDHRQVTFLELFYDLVYVVIIAELTHSLANHVDLEHLLQFSFLFVIVWWAWLNGTFYYELHGNDDIRTRVFTFAQMLCVMSMAVFAHDAIGSTSIGFAISLGAFQLILTYMWWRTGVHDPDHNPISVPYTYAYLTVTTLFFASIFVEPPIRWYLWAFATLIAILMPLLVFVLGRNNPVAQKHLEIASRASHSLVERFGLFTIIVIGEVIVNVVQGIAGQEQLTWGVGAIAVLSMVVAFAIWWLYFDTVSHRLPRQQFWSALWMYTHLPVTGGIAMIGAANLNVVEHVGETLPLEVRWLLVFSIITVLLGIAFLIHTLHPDEHFEPAYRNTQRAIIIVSVIISIFGFTTIAAVPLLACVVALLFIPIVVGLLNWSRISETLAQDVTT